MDGFDTGAEALQDAADSVSQVMEVTRRAVDGIRFLEPAPGRIYKADLVNVEKDPHRNFDSEERWTHPRQAASICQIRTWCFG